MQSPGGADPTFVGLCDVEGRVRLGTVTGPWPCTPGALGSTLGPIWSRRREWVANRPVRLGRGLPAVTAIATDERLVGLVVHGGSPRPMSVPMAAVAWGAALWVVDVSGRVRMRPIPDDGWLDGALPAITACLRPCETHVAGAHVRVLPMAAPEPCYAILRLETRPVPLPPLLAATPVQRRVAEYAAAGATVGEIARALDRSTETVRTHLAAVYERFGIGSRAELAGCCAASALLFDDD